MKMPSDETPGTSVAVLEGAAPAPGLPATMLEAAVPAPGLPDAALEATAPVPAKPAARTDEAKPVLAKKKDAIVKVRVLVDCDLGKCNDVAEVAEKDLKALAGTVDPHPDAVAYAQLLAKQRA